MPAKNNLISVVMPTYTGADNIANSLSSIAAQKVKNYMIELIVVIDGPHHQLRDLVESFRPKFEEAGKKLKVKMLPENKGRFQAILTGATLAQGKWMVFMGDRIILPPDYLKIMASFKKEAAIADTVENGWEKSAVSLTLHHLRDRIYKKRGGKIKPFYISKENFEKSGKGNGGMWLNRQLYLWACGEVSDAHHKHTSDDTKLLNVLVENGHPIYWTNKTHIIYCPRPGFLAQIDHIYKRGPRFVNYYTKPGTRYFYPLNMMVLVSLAMIAIVIIKPAVILWLLALLVAGIISASIYLMEKPKDLLQLLWSIPLIMLAFYAGLVKGLVIHFSHVKRFKVS